jgi:hypothetical protein
MYPFAARKVTAEVIGVDPAGLMAFMKRRRTELPAFLKRAFQLSRIA